MRHLRTYLIAVVGIAAVSYAFFLSSEAGSDRIFLDDVMSRRMQKNTGVYDLDHNQKFLLEQWINDNFVLKNAPPPPPAQELSIAENMAEGQELMLSNGQIYEVAPADVSVASTWLFSFPVSIEEGDHTNYPLKLINKNTNISINVRLKAAMMQGQ